MIYCRVR